MQYVSETIKVTGMRFYIFLEDLLLNIFLKFEYFICICEWLL